MHSSVREIIAARQQQKNQAQSWGQKCSKVLKECFTRHEGKTMSSDPLSKPTGTALGTRVAVDTGSWLNPVRSRGCVAQEPKWYEVHFVSVAYTAAPSLSAEALLICMMPMGFSSVDDW